ncbi:MAG: hypothetical protein AMQ22_01769 [Candidatus Methanofastidiosum methylothiophilum]|uniref:Uncharacterized protein n=1 Tax=Candidatus Methanofastidiosum methylothiophilum TaxID=1705564 RepID=A0A150IVG5_9EURY|nr:MAG: hypothetical protein AMQ22_01769 [Candidatus Methanofastidiosum methylthiophilus]
MVYIVIYEWDELNNDDGKTFYKHLKFPSYYMFEKSEKIRKNWLKTGYNFTPEKLFEEFVNLGVAFEDINVSACVDLYAE